MATKPKSAHRSKAQSKKSEPESFARLNYEHQLLSAGCDAALLKKYPNLASALAVILEYLVAEVLELAVTAASDARLVRVKTDHIYRAILDDRELSQQLIINDIHWREETAVYSGPVRETFKQIYSDRSIVSDGLTTMNKMCAVITAQIARGVNELAELPGTGDIIKAFCLKNLAGELAHHACSEATKFLSEGIEAGHKEAEKEADE